MFVGVHMMMAARLNTPELAISADEGVAFMAAAQNVLRHYSVEATQKTLDWVAFGGIAGGMYLTRGVAISNRLSQEKSERQAAGGQVLRFKGRRPNLAEVPPAAPGASVSELVQGATSDSIFPDHLGTAGFQHESEPA